MDKQVAIHKKLVKTVTHDIKSPLRFITLTGRYIYVNTQNSSTKEDIESIYTSAQQLYNFVDNFLENAKENGDNAISEPYRLYDLVQEKITFFNTIARSRNLKVNNNVSKNLEVVINRHLLSIILHNLLDNAIKNTTEGNITYFAKVHDKELHITLQDTGNGMSEVQVKYYTGLLDSHNTETAISDGMGLAIVIDLLLILGGRLKIDSTKDTGTSVTVIFPFANLHNIV